MKTTVVLSVLAVCFLVTPSNGLTVALGDLDGGHYDGLNSLDHVYTAPSYHHILIEHLLKGPSAKAPYYAERIHGFDNWAGDQLIPFTFAFEAPEAITQAWLTLVFAPTDEGLDTEKVCIDDALYRIEPTSSGGVPYYRMDDLFCVQEQPDGFITAVLNLSAHRLDLSDGLLHVRTIYDVCIDYAVLTINESPFTLLPVVFHVDDDAPHDLGPGDPDLSDPQENGSLKHPFDSIQEAIDLIPNGGKILVHPGIYDGAVDHLGKRITVEFVSD